MRRARTVSYTHRDSFQAFLDRDYHMLLFFRTPDGGVSPVMRATQPSAEFGDHYFDPGAEEQNSADESGLVPTEKVVLALLGGPHEDDRAAGLSTSLPTARPGGALKVDSSPDGRVTARLPLALGDLDSIALRQLTCTIAYSQDAEGQVVVQLTGQDGASRSGTCGLAPGSAENAPAATGTRARTTPSGTTG
ncbi:hypothetical protein [Streptomyces resistomycificus]|uniref:hypothetical protein n=1 Tax=Streptomyces resistomycificus TaxID=67356 RepID=UPI000AB81029|nr:hypothetical protein [Streptomyces resistomycificus]